MREITEREYRKRVDATCADLALRIRASGISFARIAQLTHLSYQTVSRAANNRPIRFDAVVRIEHLLSVVNREKFKRARQQEQ